MKTYHFIVNTHSGSDKGKTVWSSILSFIEKQQIDYKVYMPNRADDTTLLVSRLTNGLNEDIHIVVVGGDGTMNAVLQGIVDFEHTLLSCIRIGSGNDFARNMDIPKSYEENILHFLNTPKEYMLDYGEAAYITTSGEKNSKRFIISSGIGYDAAICEEAGRSKLKPLLNKLHLGRLVYVCIGVKQIFEKKVVKAFLQLDNEQPRKIDKLFFTVGMVHSQEGGGVPFCPHADPTDGMFHVCLVQDMPKWKLLLAVCLVYLKKHLLFEKITEHTCKNLRIKTKEAMWFHMDGETPCQTKELHLSCKQGLRFVK
ncbi:MAG: YegS/Rv2252/BmrU family lipid kinase [Clostridium sp.]|nr:YegS/Rv2252/BmrU family lipid kinase [Clostridium sp.]